MNERHYGLILGLCAPIAFVIGVWLGSLMGSQAGIVANALAAFLAAGFGGGIGASGAFLGVRLTLIGQAAEQDKQQAIQNTSVRTALLVETLGIGKRSLENSCEWAKVYQSPETNMPKPPLRLMLLPPMTIYQSLTVNIGKLTSDEIIPLMSVHHDIWRHETYLSGMGERIGGNIILNKLRRDEIYELVRNFGSVCYNVRRFIIAACEEDHSLKDRDDYLKDAQEYQDLLNAISRLEPPPGHPNSR